MRLRSEESVEMLAAAASRRSITGARAAWVPAVLAFLLGTFFLYGAGFAQPDALHNAAHDARHAFAFPCH